MTEKLKPCPCVFCGVKLIDAREIYGYKPTHWRHPDGGCILEGLAVLERDLPQWNAAWNTRATGWRTDWENAPPYPAGLLVAGGRYTRPDYVPSEKEWWLGGCPASARPTHFMLITPPDSEAPHD